MPLLKPTDNSCGRTRLLGCLLLLTIVCWLPYFARTALPIHDTSYVVESFHCFYSEMRDTGELARWFPYGNYGVQADLYQFAMHPTQYAVGCVGLVLGVQDTLLLAQLAMLLNELLFAFGMWRLGRELYASPLTAFLVSACGMLSVSWFEQSMFNFFTFYLLPLVMALVVRSLKTGKPTFLFLAGVIELCSLLGNVAYVAPLHFWTLMIFAMPLAWEYRRSVKGFVKVRHLANPSLWLMLAVLIFIGLFVSGAGENLRMLSIGRDATTGKVQLEYFLNHGRPPLIAAVFGFATGGMPHGPNTYYIGLAPLVMFVYALATERQRAFVGIAAAAAALVWLSSGGWFARLFFHLPGMNIYRHIGLTYGIIDMLLLLGAGFGCERLLLRWSVRATSQTPHQWVRPAALAVTAIVILADFWYARRPGDFTLPTLFPGWKLYLGFRICVYAAAVGLLWHVIRRRKDCLAGKRPEALPRSRVGLVWRAVTGGMNPEIIIVGLACLLDVGSFRWHMLQTIPSVEQGAVADTIFNAVPLIYRETRAPTATDERGQTTLAQLGRTVLPCNNAQYGLLCTFAGVDPCRPLYRTDIISRGVYEMLVARGGIPTLHPTDDYVPLNDKAFQRSIGWGAPKLRLASQAVTAATEEQGLRLFREMTNPDTAVLLATDAAPSGAEIHARGDATSLGTIEVTGFSSNRLRVHTVVDHAHPVWLVYADAWHPGWTATVDGRKTRVLRANIGFKAVELTGGTHDIEFVFRGRKRTILAYTVALTAAASGFGLCGWMILAVMPRQWTQRYWNRWVASLRQRQRGRQQQSLAVQG